MIFAFRGVRGFQVLLALITLVCGVATVYLLKKVADGDGALLVLPSLVLGLVFLWAFSTALRIPTSFVAITADRTRIRFAGFVDTVLANENILGARVTRRSILGGIGVRTNFSGDVALVTTWGEVAQLQFRQPVRVWLVPRLIPLKAQRLTLSLRNPQKLADRFGPPANAAPARGGGKTRQRGSRTR